MIFPITALDGHAGFAALFLTPFLIPFGIATGAAVWWGVAEQSPLNRSGAAPAPEGDLPA